MPPTNTRFFIYSSFCSWDSPLGFYPPSPPLPSSQMPACSSPQGPPRIHRAGLWPARILWFSLRRLDTMSHRPGQPAGKWPARASALGLIPVLWSRKLALGKRPSRGEALGERGPGLDGSRPQALSRTGMVPELGYGCFRGFGDMKGTVLLWSQQV